ncbi:MAG: GlsB/YeaQ/YmgE family stress response membrane protein [Sinobacteraceae bacterium]|nr:GlsB/YeaQ/YmgE family stress response membrane protein [Nevskiaceae bacterium]
MNFLIWLIVGGIIGWLAGVIMRTQEGLLLNIIVGIIGALLGGWLISPMVGAGTINQGDFSLAGLGVSLLGAIILLAIVNLFRGGGRTRL